MVEQLNSALDRVTQLANDLVETAIRKHIGLRKQSDDADAVMEPPEFCGSRWTPAWGDAWSVYDSATCQWPELRNYNCLRGPMLDQVEHALRHGHVVGVHADEREATALSAELSARVGGISARYDPEAGLVFVRVREPDEVGAGSVAEAKA